MTSPVIDGSAGDPQSPVLTLLIPVRPWPAGTPARPFAGRWEGLMLSTAAHAEAVRTAVERYGVLEGGTQTLDRIAEYLGGIA